LTSDFLEVFDLSPNVPGGTYARFPPSPADTHGYGFIHKNGEKNVCTDKIKL